MGVRPDEKRVFKNYKFVVTKNNNPNFKAYYRTHEEIEQDLGIPKTTFYAMIRGVNYKKWSDFNINKCRISVKEVPQTTCYTFKVSQIKSN